jgi:hypothetical protein
VRNPGCKEEGVAFIIRPPLSSYAEYLAFSALAKALAGASEDSVSFDSIWDDVPGGYSKSYYYSLLRQLHHKGLVGIKRQYWFDFEMNYPTRGWRYSLTPRGRRLVDPLPR